MSRVALLTAMLFAGCNGDSGGPNVDLRAEMLGLWTMTAVNDADFPWVEQGPPNQFEIVAGAIRFGNFDLAGNTFQVCRRVTIDDEVDVTGTLVEFAWNVQREGEVLVSVPAWEYLPGAYQATVADGVLNLEWTGDIGGDRVYTFERATNDPGAALPGCGQDD